MKYGIDIDMVKDTFEFKDNIDPNKSNLTHYTNVKFKMLPYVANDKNQVNNLEGSIGAFTRRVNRVQMKDQAVDHESLMNSVYKNIEVSDSQKYKLSDIIKELYFTKDEKMYLFSVQALNYIVSNKAEEKIAYYLYDALYDESLDTVAKESFHDKESNVLDKLMFKSLPQLNEGNFKDERYLSLIPYVKTVFNEDFNYLLSQPELLKTSLNKFLTYYYFYYVSQLCLKLNRGFEATREVVEPMFFSLDWEKISKSRNSYTFGWKKLEAASSDIFAHAVLLEMLNQNLYEEKYDYIGLKSVIDGCSEEERDELNDKVLQLISLYKEYIKDFNFDSVIYEEEKRNDIFYNIKHLQSCINRQFINSTRKRANDAYKSWFTNYCKANVLKNRHSLSYTLNITEDMLIFMTKLCIKDQEKLKLKDLFKEFEKRGLYLDNKSKEEVTAFYEKLNLIEKKSDSGDAQYVKGIL